MSETTSLHDKKSSQTVTLCQRRIAKQFLPDTSKVCAFFINTNIILVYHISSGRTRTNQRHPTCKKLKKSYSFCLLFTIYIPMETKSNAPIVKPLTTLFSSRISADKNTPATGLINPKTATFDTGLYVSKIPHTV